MITIPSLQLKILGLISYMKLKIKCEDWHGVADAAMDIREIEAQIQLLNQLNAQTK